MIPFFAKVAGVAVGYIFARGKTGELGAFQPQHAKAAAQAICDQLGDIPDASAQEMGAVVARAGYTVDAEGKPTEFDWPPRWLADKTHKAVWKQLLTWCEVIRTNAAEAGVGVCEYLQDPLEPIPPVPPFMPGGVAPGPNTPGPGVPLNPGSASTAMPLPPTSTPVPGQSYKVQPGDTFFGAISQAYGVGPGQARIDAARAVSDHPINRANATYFYATSGPESAWFPDGRISFGAPYQTFYFPVL